MNLQLLTEELGKFENLSYVYGSFPDNTDPPYVTYNSIEAQPICADGVCLFTVEQVELSLVTTKRDMCLENQIENMFFKHGVTFDIRMEFDEDQKIHTVTYTFAVD